MDIFQLIYRQIIGAWIWIALINKGEEVYKEKLEKGIRIKVIGDSLAAGGGSSLSYRTEELIYEDDGKNISKKLHLTAGGDY